MDGDDAHSNIQMALDQKLGRLWYREPGPHDPPGPKYESYDSGPSFGNFGPLPMDDGPPASMNPYAHWNGGWNAEGSMNGGMNGIGLTEGGQAAYPAGTATAQSVRQPSEFAASPRQQYVGMQETPRSRAVPMSPSKSQKAPSVMSGPDKTMSPRAPSRVTNRDETPLSPASGRSKLSIKAGSAYPPLPAGGATNYEPMSPSAMSRAGRSKAPSISPSDSPSNTKVSYPPKSPYNGSSRSPPPGSVMSGGGGHQSRPFSPYRHAPTTEDLLHAAIRGRALVIPEEDEKEPSVAARSKAPSVMSQRSKSGSQVNGKARSQMSQKAPSQISKTPSQASQRAPSQVSHVSTAKQPSVAASRQSHASRTERSERDGERTPTPSRPHSPEQDERLDPEETRIVQAALATPRTSFYAASITPDTVGPFHDHELCVLLEEERKQSHNELVRKALRKAIRQRVKKLGMRYDADSINKYRRSYQELVSSGNVHQQSFSAEEPPQWAADIKRELMVMQQRIESLGPKIEGLKSPQEQSVNNGQTRYYEDDYTRTPMTQTVNIQTQPGTMADSVYQPHDTVVMEDEHDDEHDYDDDNRTATQPRAPSQLNGDTHSQHSFFLDTQDDSPGQQFLEEELYKLRQKPAGSQSGQSHRTWEVAPETHRGYENPSGLPTIPDTNGDFPEGERSSSPPLPPIPDHDNDEPDHPEMAVASQGAWHPTPHGGQDGLSPWQRVHERLLDWALMWRMSELDSALNSTTRNNQVNEVALNIWSTQTYKRYVRARLTDNPPGVVDRLFVPPTIADDISNAVFYGRHGDACGMLRNLWAPLGLDGMPRLLVVLAKHRADPNHWVVHRFSLPDGGLTTYDSYPERTLPDGRPLGWWFAIRIAWPNAIYPSPDHLVQKMVRLHRPMQLPIDNSVAAAGIWRNILMGSRAERSLDLERLRDLINTEVKNLRQRKQMGKLSVGIPRPTWEDMS
ncbi:hypothetical protein BDQ17DRAFT_1346684 [Cyathus striatus]|nr:hypothetical protein BDQ17DRAFT_1346684 [Cyathus striatus]